MTASIGPSTRDPDFRPKGQLGRESYLYGEPSLRELLDDPVLHVLMLRDRITREEIIGLTISIRLALNS
jgi:hypothetical protein